MKFQIVTAACFGAAAIVAAGCASGPAPESALHASSPAMPTALSRQQLARDFHPGPARMVAMTPDADPSFALAHETQSLQPEKARSSVHAVAPASPNIPLGLAAATGATPPEGWRFVNENMLHNDKSGLECPLKLELEDENRRFLLQSVAQFDDKGFDIGCAMQTEDGAALTLYASYWPEMSLEDSASGAVAAIAKRFPIKSELSVAVISLEGDETDPVFDGLETPSAAGFDIGEVNGVAYKTSLWLVKTQGWHVKARATYPQGDQTSELVSAISFAFSHLNVRAKNLNHPVTAGGEV